MSSDVSVTYLPGRSDLQWFGYYLETDTAFRFHDRRLGCQPKHIPREYDADEVEALLKAQRDQGGGAVRSMP